MSGGARRAAPGRTSVLMRIAGPAVAVALLATVVVLLVFGDRLVGGGGSDQGDKPLADQEVAAAQVDAAQRDEVVDAAATVLNRWS